MTGSHLIEYVRQRMNQRAEGREWQMEFVTVDHDWESGQSQVNAGLDFYYPVLPEGSVFSVINPLNFLAVIGAPLSNYRLTIQGDAAQVDLDYMAYPIGDYFSRVRIRSVQGMEFSGQFLILTEPTGGTSYTVAVPFIKARIIE